MTFVSLQDEELYEQASDVRTQLKFFEHLEKMEKQRKDDEEREILMKAAKVGWSEAVMAADQLIITSSFWLVKGIVSPKMKCW